MTAATYNLIYNGDFTCFSNQGKDSSGVFSYQHPDGWVFINKGSDGGVTKVNDACAITTSSENGNICLSQNLHEFPRWKNYLLGGKISAVVTLTLLTDCNASVTLTDGVNNISQAFSKKGDHTARLCMIVNELSSFITIKISCQSNSATIYIHSASANIGDQNIRHLPCIVNGYIGERRQYISSTISPPTELSLCENPIELTENQTRLESVINKRFGVGSQGRSLLPDMRGYFSRAYDNGANRDTDASSRVMLGKDTVKGDFPGTSELDQFLMHDHDLKYKTASVLKGSTGQETGITTLTSSKTESRGGKETRPKNVSELYTIKWA